MEFWLFKNEDISLFCGQTHDHDGKHLAYADADIGQAGKLVRSGGLYFKGNTGFDDFSRNIIGNADIGKPFPYRVNYGDRIITLFRGLRLDRKRDVLD
jgi:hypothetical protein